MSEDWPDSYPQNELPTGMVEIRYNPYRRQLEQVKLATRFMDDAPALPAVAILPLVPIQLAVRCCHHESLRRLWCQNPTAFLIHMERDGQEKWVPACPEHLAPLVRGVAEGNAMEEADQGNA